MKVWGRIVGGIVGSLLMQSFIIGLLTAPCAITIHAANSTSATNIASSSADLPPIDLKAFHTIASFTYENQKLERGKYGGISKTLAAFGANWPCLWGEEVTGDMGTWKKNWNEYKDGWKFTCGLRRIPAPCLVYSLGSCGNMAFEKGLLEDNPACVIHIFDKNQHGVKDWFPDEAKRKEHIRFHRIFIGGADNATASPPVMTLKSIMEKRGHTHIDVLKVDIEGSEWEALAGDLPSIGQLLVEVHEEPNTDENTRLARLIKLFDNLERHGLRAFHKEVNARYNLNCMEFAFIQEKWSPAEKSYKH